MGKNKGNNGKGGPPTVQASAPAPAAPRTAAGLVTAIAELFRTLGREGAPLSESDLHEQGLRLLALEEGRKAFDEATVAAQEARVEADQAKKDSELAKAEAEKRETKARIERENWERERKEAERQAEELRAQRAGLEAERKCIADDRKHLEAEKKRANEERDQLNVRQRDEELRLADLETQRLTALDEKCQRALANFRQQRGQLEEELATQQARKAALETEQLQKALEHNQRTDAELLRRTEQVREQVQEELRGHFDQVSQDRAGLANERRELEARRADATAGFASANAAMAKQLEAQVDALRNELAETRQRIDAERQAWTQERAEAEEHFRRERQEVKRERRLLELDKIDRQAIRDAVAQARIQELETTLTERDARISALNKQLGEFREALLGYEKIGWRTGNEGPEVLLARNNDLQRQVEELQARMAAMLPESEREQLRNLQADYERLEDQLAKTQAELSQHKTRAASRDGLELEVNRLKLQRDGHERMVKMLQAEREELQKKLDDLVSRDQAQSPFPECAKIDAAKAPDPVALWKPTDLATLVDQVQARLAAGVVTDAAGRKKQLYYEPRDLQLFVGGLSMSQLHIFQGPSGTGKTTLPSAFATAVGAGQKLIPVQAGWRDRTDLLGHWNAFERRFYETKFLQGLYASGAEGPKDKPYFLILDEMNLSRVEQYFADLLSALEAPDDAQRLVPVMAEGQKGAPKRFVDGKELWLGRNVWFIGTANHDETTIEFADKTYDRAFVHELPEKHPDPHRLPSPVATGPLDVQHLESLFTAASQAHGPQAVSRLTAFGELIRKDLRQFGIVWAKRLERQAERFVPSVIAAGGSQVDAFDHLMTTRLLRKLRRRHDLRPEDFKQLLKDYEEAFSDAFEGTPTRGLALLKAEQEQADRNNREVA